VNVVFIVQALILAVERKCVSDSLETSIDDNTIVQMHVVEVVAVRSAGLLGILSRLLITMNFRVSSAKCTTHEGRVECIMNVEGTRMGTLLWELRHNREYFQNSTARFKIVVHRVAEECFLLDRRVHNPKSMHLTHPHNPSSLRVHQRKELQEGCRSSRVVVYLESPWPLLFVSRNLADMHYKIFQASIDHSYAFLVIP